MKTAVMLLTLALATACMSVPGGSTVDYRTLTTGTNAAATPSEQQIEFASDETTYRRLWNQLIGMGEAPEIDFTQESVAFLLAGQKPTGGFTVNPTRARIEGRTLVVHAIVNTPTTDSVTTQALTSPYAVVAVRRLRPFEDVRWAN